MRSLTQIITDVGRKQLQAKASTQIVPINPAPQPIRELKTKVYAPPAPTQHAALAAFESSPFVHTIVDRVSSMCAGQDFYLRRKSSRDRKILDHPALNFLHSGNEIMDGFQCRRLLQAHIDLAGEAFLMIGYDADGQAASYLPIPPHWVTQPAYRDGQTFDVHLPRGGGQARIPWRGMIWIKRPRPLDPLDRGYSVTRALLQEINLNDEITSFFYNFVKNRARPDIIITGSKDDPLSAEDAQAMEARWLQKHGGTANAGKPMFSNAPLEVHEVGQTMQEARADQMRKLSRDFISEVYGVPPEIFGRVENSNRATADAADYTMARYVVEPRLKAQVAALYPRLVVEFPDLIRYSLCFESPVQEDKDHQLNVMRATPSAFKKNEARIMAGLEPVPDGDVYLNEATGATAGTAAGDPNALADGNTDSAKKFLSKAIPSTDIDAIVSAIDDNDQSTLALILLFLLSAATAAVINLGPSRSVMAEDIGPELEAWAAERAIALRNYLNETTRQDVAQELGNAGEDRGALILAIVLLFDRWARERAPMIASTEANGALGAVEIMVAKQAVLDTKIWITQADERVRDQHRPMHGQVRDAGVPFDAPNGEQAMAPGGFPSAALNAGCRCGVHAFNDEPPDAATMTSLLARHEAALKQAEQMTLAGVRALLDDQRRAIIARIGEIMK
jgi:phage portal protein BeeE